MDNRDESKYSAMDIAKYAVNRQYKSNRPISNLQLQKILYFYRLSSRARLATYCSPINSRHGLMDQ